MTEYDAAPYTHTTVNDAASYTIMTEYDAAPYTITTVYDVLWSSAIYHNNGIHSYAAAKPHIVTRSRYTRLINPDHNPPHIPDMHVQYIIPQNHTPGNKF
jgi:hypothetical protein